MIDVGGGSGGLAIALCEEHPMLKATIVDLPSVVPIATQLVSEAGLTDRINVTTADIIIRPPKGKFDIATARSFFQVLSIEQCKRAAQNISSSLITGGTLFILGMLTDDTRLSPSAAVGMNLVFMNMFDNGQAYTETEYRSWLANAEFIKISRKPHLMGYDLITAEKS